MLQRPNAVCLTVCQQAIVEERTRNLTLVNRFTGLGVEAFPSPSQQFVVCVILNDGLGTLSLTLRVISLDDLEPVYERTVSVTFVDPLQEVRFVYRVTGCSFPEAGRYQVALFHDGDEIAQNVIRVYATGGTS